LERNQQAGVQACIGIADRIICLKQKERPAVAYTTLLALVDAGTAGSSGPRVRVSREAWPASKPPGILRQ